MYTTGKNAEELQDMIDRRERRIQEQGDSEKDRSEIAELKELRDELLRFTPGTLVLDPETGFAYRRREFGGYSYFNLDGAVGMTDNAPENVQIIWKPND